MRLKASEPIMLKNKILGGDRPLICVPVASVNHASLMDEIDEVISMEPDVIEWRADYFEDVLDFSKVNNILETLKAKAGEIPVIFTCRSRYEGGHRKIEDEIRLELYNTSIVSGCIDATDAELSFGKDKIETIKSKAQKNGVKLILSYHNFSETPSEEFMLQKLKAMAACGADIPKLAVMAMDQEDVIRLFNATLRARKEIAKPLVTISMGIPGAVTRMTGWIFGSDMTYAAGVNSSAPGQMPIDKMRRFIDLFSKEHL